MKRRLPNPEKYGYNTPRRPELHAVRVMVCESEVREYQRRYPALALAQILDVMKAAGPLREAVEAALQRLAAPVAARSS